jgi:multifunctional 2-oxoglutarate metabolism enzyme
VIDRVNGQDYVPLQHLEEGQANFHVYDSLLSEYAALGFEYGYSVARPEALVLWEAQFGDFVNGAQSIIDEYISAGEAKWGQKSGVVLLLPHGYEGQGPDHSSARIERFLALCAEDAMTVAQPSTPASYFHLLRRHSLQGEHNPLIVFTPKQLLRLKAAVSQPEEFTHGTFRPVLNDAAAEANPAAVQKVLLASGRVTYDLLAERKKAEPDKISTAILRVEQLYPLAAEEIKAELAKYPNLEEVRWVQDEPANQGPWPFMALNLTEHLGGKPFYRVSRPAMSAPSVGSHNVHLAEQATLMKQAFS